MRKIGTPVIVVIIVALIIGISIAVASIIFTPEIRSVPRPHPAVSTVVFVENAQEDQSDNHGIYPKIITVVIGVNNTVRWVNQDTIPHGKPIPDDDNVDPNFTKTEASFYNETSGEGAFIMPGQSYEYTFNVPGKIDYHMVPHPQMKGTVIVLHALPTT